MKEVTVTVQFVITTEVSDDTDLERMERSVEDDPVKFVQREFIPMVEFAHVSVEPS